MPTDAAPPPAAAPLDLDLDLDAVAAFLAAHQPDFRSPLVATKFATGQSNPTFRLDSPSGAYVLRRKPSGALLKSAHAVDREFRVQSAVAAAGVPTPRMIALCEDADVIGSIFYVMGFTPGRNFVDPRLPDLDNGARAAVYDAMNATLAQIHNVDVAAVGLSDFGRPADYFGRQRRRWSEQYRATETETIPEMDALIDWLAAQAPADDARPRLVHGDYRIDNLIFADDAPTIAAVLDWELSTLGHPLSDLAYQCMQWRMPTGEAGRGLDGVDRAALGIPTEDAYIARYCERRGLAEAPDFDVWLAFSFFRMAAIVQGVKKRALDGNASNPKKAMEMAAFIPLYARKGIAAAGM